MDSLEIFPLSKTCENNYVPVIYDNPCYFDKSYDNPLFMHNFEMHVPKEFCLQNVYNKALDDDPMLLDNINCSTNETVYAYVGSNDTFMHVDHNKNALCAGYFVEFIHDATKSYYERENYGCRIFHLIKTSLYMLKVLKLLLFYVPMLVTLLFYEFIWIQDSYA